MKKIVIAIFVISGIFTGNIIFAQQKDSTLIAAIIKEGNSNSQLKMLAHELLDGIGPRLVGSPKMQQAHDWAVAKYSSWNIGARNEK